uniref:Uncharacterized protein n=1 Tax=Amphimedon queenslandica TaxID=400682 RepID=A0A1X7UCC9_AMPQE
MHVKSAVEFPPLNDGSGKELHKLYDTIQQHLRALKSMGQEPLASFITSITELKLDATNMFVWQRHCQSHVDVPHYYDILQFIDHRAQASESINPIVSKREGKGAEAT